MREARFACVLHGIFPGFRHRAHALTMSIMCGIAGIVAWEDRFGISRDLLRRMSAAIAHRGPDGDEISINHLQQASPENPQAGFAFRRLAILDLDPRAMQPMTDGRRTLVFNGEIYNFRELRDRLNQAAPGYAWQTTGDTEVLLRAFAVYGEKCVDHLNGMFAFAVWDAQDRSLFITRDRMGQKPLYFAVQCDSDAGQRDSDLSQRSIDAAHRDAGALPRESPTSPARAIAFASELPALFALPWIDRRINDDSLLNYLRFGWLPHGQTIYRGVQQLLPAHCMRITRAGVTTRKYFDESRSADSADDASGNGKNSAIPRRDRSSIVVATKKLLARAVQRQLISDVPLGCFLSGGIDSSIIASIMRKLVPANQPVMTFSIGFDDPRYDETQYALEVAKHLGTQHHQFIVHPSAAADLPAIAASFGEPFGDSSALPTYYLSRETRRHVKVALSGDGGDELFAGYDRYRALRLSANLRKFAPASALRLLAKITGKPTGHPKSAITRAKRFIASLQYPAARRYSNYLRLMEDDLIVRLLQKPPTSAQLTTDPIAEAYEQAREEKEIIPAAMSVDRAIYLPDDLLAKVDRASMLHALEVRSPFMDHELVAFAAGLKTNQLLSSHPKQLLREAFANDLPLNVFARKKMGFAIPIGHWLRTSLRPMLQDHLFAADSFASAYFNRAVIEQMIDDHQREKADHSQRLYALLMLELWWKSQS
jgi:asparagine synthase (glutamine-hydrolysing)